LPILPVSLTIPAILVVVSMRVPQFDSQLVEFLLYSTSEKFSVRGEQTYVVRRDSIFARVKLLTPILRTFPFLTSSSIAFHVSAIGTSITEICSVTGSTGNLSDDLGKATGQWIRYRSR
jgi:hypothetical protein